jgi:hypothetical protein
MKPIGTNGINPPPVTAMIAADGLESTPQKSSVKKTTRKGRYPTFERPPTHADLFPDGKTDRM